MTAKKPDATSVGQAADDEPVFGNEDIHRQEEDLEELEPIGEVGSLDDLLDEFMALAKQPAEPASSPVLIKAVPGPPLTERLVIPPTEWVIPPTEKTKPLGSTPTKPFGKGGTAQWEAGVEKPEPADPPIKQLTLDELEEVIQGEPCKPTKPST